MKKLIIMTISLMSPIWCFAGAFDAIKNQLIDQTKVTIHKSGGAAGFYDASEGNSESLRGGVIDHVLTNRWLTLDAGWFSTDNSEGVLVGGLGVSMNGFLNSVFPQTTDKLETYVPPLLRQIDVGAFSGWGTDSGTFHYGLSLLYNFGE